MRGVESKPIITYSGDQNLFSSLQSGIIQGLPQEAVEWRRSYGRLPKTVYLEASFVPFSEELLSKEGEWSLLGKPFLHTYWTDCNDLELYKATVKEEISAWFSTLKARNISDWMVIVVVNVDSKKSNKTKLLPRTSVLDKVKSDFPSKNAERCASLLDPFRTDTRAAESWQVLLQRLRHLLLLAYSRQLSQYEEHVRTQRERRNEPGWNFCNFFILQEELAFVFEMLGLYDEALVQYDELDALFSQFVINSNMGDMPAWMNTFTQSCDTWSGLCLSWEGAQKLRELLKEGKGTLLDLRNYLFSRQCELLLLLYQPWEVAHRSLPFLQNCVNELNLLEVSMPPGAVACWVFLSCLEVLQTCERFSDSTQMEAYSLYTVELWAYAREKLHELGILCGLMPGLKATSECLHCVVRLLSGMEPRDGTDKKGDCPQERLREALSSEKAFLKHYLELSELTMGTFKHISRMRSARLIGKDLADLYMKLGEPHKAVTFLTDLLKMYKDEQWEILAVKTQEELALCASAMKDTKKLAKASCRLAASIILDDEKRQHHFKIAQESASLLDCSDPLCMRTEKIFHISDAKVICKDKYIIENSTVEVYLQIKSNMPNDLSCQRIKISLKHDPVYTQESSKLKEPIQHRPLSSSASTNSISGCAHEETVPLIHIPLDLATHMHYSSEGVLNAVAIVCHNTHQLLRRRDSHSGFPQDKEITKDDFTVGLAAEQVLIKPGVNCVIVKAKVKETGNYTLNQVCIEWDNIHFVLPHLIPCLSFVVIKEMPTLRVHSGESSLLAGVEQSIKLAVFSGSHEIQEGIVVQAEASRGLVLNANDSSNHFEDKVKITLPKITPFQTNMVIVKVLANLGPQRDAATVEHHMNLNWPWTTQPISIPLHFLAPFMSLHKLHTCNARKYLQIEIHGLTASCVSLKDPKLHPSPSNKENQANLSNSILKPLCISQELVVNREQPASFLWEFLHESLPSKTKRFVFSVNYRCNNSDSGKWRQYDYDFSINKFKTLFTVKASVEPLRGSEFCRAGNVCNMHVEIVRIDSNHHATVMYEVVADQAWWSVCGRAAGVVTLEETEKHSVVLEVMPLVGGFLPLPTIRLSKYITSGQPVDGNGCSTAKLEPFDPGQVYSWSRANQVHVLPAPGTTNPNPDVSIQ